ncbi:unnamed protein product, partial [Polarella glacialis]
MAPRSALASELSPSLGEAAPRPAAEADSAVVAAGGQSSNLGDAVLHGGALVVRQKAQEWAELCSRDLPAAVLEALSLTLLLAGLPGAITAADLNADPAALLARLPEWVRDQGLDPQLYPLLPSAKQGKRSVANFEKFWTFGLGAQNGIALLDSQLVASLTKWLLILPQASIRSVRHAATVAALAVAEALGHHSQALARSHETLAKQLK